MNTKPRSKRPLIFAFGALLAIPLLLLLTQASEFNTFYVCGVWAKKWIVFSLGLCWLAAGGFAAWRSRRALFGFGMASVMGFVMLALLELLGIVGALNYAAALGTRDSGTGLGYQAIPHQTFEGKTVGNITFEWSLRDRPEYEISFRADHRGFRNPTDREAADVYLVGDSFIVGGLVDFPHTIAGRMESTLERPIMNIALTGLSPAGARDLLLDSEPKVPLENRLVVQFLFEGNDLRDTVWDRQKKEKKPEGLRARSLTVNLLEVFTRWSLPAKLDAGHDRSASFNGETYYFKEILGWSPELDPEVETIMGTLQEVRDRVEAAGGRYLVAMFPTKLRVLAPHSTFPETTRLTDLEQIMGPTPTRFRDACAEAKIPYLDLTPALVAAGARGEVTFYTDDTHLNAHGLGVCTDALLAWEPLKEWLEQAK